MKMSIKKNVLAIVAIVTMIVGSLGASLNVKAASGYTAEKALNYAEAHYNDGVGFYVKYVLR